MVEKTPTILKSIWVLVVWKINFFRIALYMIIHVVVSSALVAILKQSLITFYIVQNMMLRGQSNLSQLFLKMCSLISVLMTNHLYMYFLMVPIILQNLVIYIFLKLFINIHCIKCTKWFMWKWYIFWILYHVLIVPSVCSYHEHFAYKEMNQKIVIYVYSIL